MPLVYFSKMFQEANVGDLIGWGHKIGVDGYDLAVRPGYLVSPDQPERLVPVVNRLKSEGLVVPMVTAPTDLTDPQDPRAEPLLKAMAEADVRLLKLGYYRFNVTQDYWAMVDEVRADLARWEQLGRTYGITVCYHTHSWPFLGLNAAGLAHLIRGFDPQHVAAYLDPGHLLKTGEPFDVAVAIVRGQLAIVGVKDRSLPDYRWVPAGEGNVDWPLVFDTLVKEGFAGPITIHAEYEKETFAEYLSSLREEVAFFRARLQDAVQRSKEVPKEPTGCRRSERRRSDPS